MASWLSGILANPEQAGGSSPSGGQSGPEFQAGQTVEYYSATLQNWMPAKVLQYNAYTSTYNLDCKPDVPINRIRAMSGGDQGGGVGKAAAAINPAAGGGGGGNSPASRVSGVTPAGPPPNYAPGQFGQGAGIPPDAAQPAGGDMNPATVVYTVGSQVEYYSATAQSWIPAKVQYVNSDGTFNLDCKPLVSRDRIRPIRQGGGSVVSLSAAPAAPPHQPQPLHRLPSPESAVPGSLPASGASPLSATSGVDPASNPVFPPPLPASSQATAASASTFQPNQTVEYLSGTLNQWISARVLSVNNDGTYNLDCKPLVSADRIRVPGGGAGAAPVQIGDVRLEDGGSRSEQSAGSKSRPSTMAVIPEIESFADHPMKSATTIKSLDGPIQLIRMQKSSSGETKFELCKEAVEILRGMGSVKLSVISCCGSYRSGKSFLLNLLLDRVQQQLPGFQVGVNQGTYTKGIWMFALKPSVDDGHCYLYLDCEGFGGQGDGAQPGAFSPASIFGQSSSQTPPASTADPKLLALSILISSLFILNVKGGLTEENFQNLQVVKNLQGFIEDQGVIMNKPSLVLLLRDFSLSLEDTYGNPYTADEYMERALSSQPDYPFEKEKQQAAKETRMAMFKFFPDRRCRTLVPPMNNTNDETRLAAMGFGELRPDFKALFTRLQDEIFRIGSALGPKRVGKDMAYLTARAFPSFLAHLCDTLNANQKLELCNSWDRVAESSCCNSVENLTAEYREAIDLLKTKFPMSDASLTADLKALKQHMRERFRDEALGDEAMRLQYWNELKDGIILDNKKLWEDNNRSAENKLLRVLQANEGSARSPAEVLKEVEHALNENLIPVKCCHMVGQLLLKAYLQVLDGTKLTEQRMKEHEEEKATLRTSINQLEQGSAEEKKKMEDRVSDLTADLDAMRKKHAEEVQTGKELREHLEHMADKGTDKEKDLVKALQEADAKYRSAEKTNQDAIEAERKKREDERASSQTEIARLKEEHRTALDREHESAKNAWEQLRTVNANQTSLQTKMDELQGELAKANKKGAPCQCVVM